MSLPTPAPRRSRARGLAARPATAPCSLIVPARALSFVCPRALQRFSKLRCSCAWRTRLFQQMDPDHVALRTAQRRKRAVDRSADRAPTAGQLQGRAANEQRHRLRSVRLQLCHIFDLGTADRLCARTTCSAREVRPAPQPRRHRATRPAVAAPSRSSLTRASDRRPFPCVVSRMHPPQAEHCKRHPWFGLEASWQSCAAFPACATCGMSIRLSHSTSRCGFGRSRSPVAAPAVRAIRSLPSSSCSLARWRWSARSLPSGVSCVFASTGGRERDRERDRDPLAPPQCFHRPQTRPRIALRASLEVVPYRDLSVTVLRIDGRIKIVLAHKSPPAGVLRLLVASLLHLHRASS